MRHGGHDLRCGGDLKYAVKPDAQQPLQNGGAGAHAGKLPVKRLRGESDRVFVFAERFRERVHPRLHRVARTDADALAAVYAPLAQDGRFAVADADRLRGAALHAPGAADAFLVFKIYRSVADAHDDSFPAYTVIERVVPFPTSECMSKSSLYFFMLGRPIPAPKPSARMFWGAVDQPACMASSTLGMPGPWSVKTTLTASGVIVADDHVDLRLVRRDGDAADHGRSKAELLQHGFDMPGGFSGTGKIVAGNLILTYERAHFAPVTPC